MLRGSRALYTGKAVSEGIGLLPYSLPVTFRLYVRWQAITPEEYRSKADKQEMELPPRLTVAVCPQCYGRLPVETVSGRLTGMHLSSG